MPAPIDAAALENSIESITESVEGTKRYLTECLEQLRSHGVCDVAEQLAEAASGAGMPRATAARYAGDYDGAMRKVREDLLHAENLISDVIRNLNTASHIAVAVPHRCPGSPDPRGLILRH